MKFRTDTILCLHLQAVVSVEGIKYTYDLLDYLIGEQCQPMEYSKKLKKAVAAPRDRVRWLKDITLPTVPDGADVTEVYGEWIRKIEAEHGSTVNL